jgi:hypothetical protein
MSRDINPEDLGLMYPLNSKYRLYRKVKIQDAEKELEFYGPYASNNGVKGMKDGNSWKQVVKLWTPDTRIFAKLPISEEDLKRAIPGERKYIIEIYHGIEKIDKPFGYGTSDYWHSFRFRNVNEVEAQRLIRSLIEQGCLKNKFNVGLELVLNQDELVQRDNGKKRVLQRKVLSFFGGK